MKKAIIFAVVCAFVCCLGGCAAGGAPLFPDADKIIVGDAELTDPVENIEIDWASGIVTIQADSGSTVRLSEKAGRSLPEDSRMHWWLEGSTLHVAFSASPKVFSLDELFPFAGEKELTVLVPQTMSLNDLTIDTASAEVTVSDLTAGSVSVETASGAISAVCKAGDIELASSSGAITLTAGSTDSISAESASGAISAAFREAGSVELESSSGSISVSGGIADRIDVDTASGAITIAMESAPKSCCAESASGKITMYLPENADFTAEIETSSGEFNSDFALVKNGNTYTGGSGGARLELETASGDISVLKK